MGPIGRSQTDALLVQAPPSERRWSVPQMIVAMVAILAAVFLAIAGLIALLLWLR